MNIYNVQKYRRTVFTKISKKIQNSRSPPTSHLFGGDTSGGHSGAREVTCHLGHLSGSAPALKHSNHLHCPFNKMIPHECICCFVTRSQAKIQTRAPVSRSVGSTCRGPSSQTFISPSRSHVWAPTSWTEALRRHFLCHWRAFCFTRNAGLVPSTQWDCW